MITLSRTAPIIALFIAALPASAQPRTATPTLCEMLILVEAHEWNAYCAKPLDPSSEQIYRESVAILSRFMFENDPRHALPNAEAAASTWEQQIRRRYSTGDHSVCEKDFGRSLQPLLQRLTTPEALEKLREAAKIPSDPNPRGSCL